MAKLLPLDPIITPLDPSSTRPRIRTRTRKSNIPINTKNPSSKVLDNIIDKSSGVGPEKRFAPEVKKLGIKNGYDSIKYLEDKLNDTSLNFDEYKKILNDIN